MGRTPTRGRRLIRFDPEKAMGAAFAFDAGERERNTGQLRVDDIRMLPGASQKREGEE